MSKQQLIKVTAVVLLFLLLPGLTQADSGSESLRQVIDDYQVELVFMTGQPQTGNNELAIKLHHPHGQPLADAVVKVTVARPEPVEPLPHPEAEKNSAHQEMLLSDPHETDTGGHGEPATAETGQHDEPEAHTGAGDHGQAGNSGHGEPVAAEAGQHDESEAHTGAGGHGHASSDGHGELAEVALAAGPTAGEYTGQVSFSDTGQWLLKVNFVVNGEAKETAFVVEAARNASRWLVINGFLGLNALVILAAAITKRKYVNTKKGKAVA